MPSPYMPLYIADYMSDTAHLSTLEHGAYILLIMTYWQSGKPLPADDAKLSRICHLSEKKFQKVKTNVLEFFSKKNEKLHHSRIDKELHIYKEKSDKSRAAGVKSGEARREKKRTDAQQTLNECSTDVERTLNHTDAYTYTDIKKEIIKEKKSKKRTVDENRKILEAFLVTDEHIIYSSENGLPHPDSKIEQFKTHHLARPKSLREISDWKLAFYNWLRNAKDYQQQRGLNHATNQRTTPKSKTQLHWEATAPGAFKGTELERLYPSYPEEN